MEVLGTQNICADIVSYVAKPLRVSPPPTSDQLSDRHLAERVLTVMVYQTIVLLLSDNEQ